MIPILLFSVLSVSGIVMLIYSMVDHKNRLYANVVIAFLSGLLEAFLGSAISVGAVYETVTTGLTMVVVNMSNATSNTQLNILPVESPSVGFFLYFVSTIGFAYTIFMAYEIIDETLQSREANIAKNNDEDGYK